MKTRRAKVNRESVPAPGFKVQVVFVDEPTGMVTLDDPTASLDGVKDAFVRLRPAETLTPEQVRSWVNVVRPLARAYRILPSRRSAVLPGCSPRVNTDQVIGSVREEVRTLVGAINDVELHEIVEAIMSEVE